MHNTPDSPASAIIGKPITQAAEEVKLIDPQTYISADCPPFFIQHGTKDPLVPYLQSVILANALYKVIGKEKVQVALLEGAGHGGSLFDAPENLYKVYAFLDKHLKSD